jgi:hypothetical protein
MDMGWVVPEAREGGGGTVEDDAAADEHESLHEPLDGAELVRDVEDRGAELDVKLLEQLGEGLLRFHVDTGGRLVEDDEVRLPRQGLRDVGALALPAREAVNRHVGAFEQADAIDCSPNGGPIRRREGTEDPSPRNAARRHELLDGHRRLDPEERSLREVAQPSSVLEAMGLLTEEEGLARRRPLQAEGEADERGLAAAVRAGDAHELTRGDVEIDVSEDGRAARVRERQVSK